MNLADSASSVPPAFARVGLTYDDVLLLPGDTDLLPDEIDSAGKASKLLERLDKRRDAGLTTPKQIRFLEGRGFRHVGTWTFDSAKQLIDRIAANGWRTPKGIVPASYVPELMQTPDANVMPSA